MDIGCVELLLREERKISIGCTGVEDALGVTMAQQTELDYLSIIFCEQSPERTYQRIFPVDGRLRKSENEDKISIRCHASVPFPEIWVRQWTRLACGHCLSHLSAAANLSYPAGSSDKRRPQFLRSAYPQMGAAAAHLQGHASRCNSNAANRLRFLNSVHSCYPAPLQADAFPDNGFGSVKRPFPVPDG